MISYYAIGPEEKLALQNQADTMYQQEIWKEWPKCVTKKIIMVGVWEFMYKSIAGKDSYDVLEILDIASWEGALRN